MNDCFEVKESPVSEAPVSMVNHPDHYRSKHGGEEMIVIIGDKELAVLQKVWGKILTMIEGKPTFDEAYEVYELFCTIPNLVNSIESYDEPEENKEVKNHRLHEEVEEV